MVSWRPRAVIFQEERRKRPTASNATEKKEVTAGIEIEVLQCRSQMGVGWRWMEGTISEFCWALQSWQIAQAKKSSHPCAPESTYLQRTTLVHIRLIDVPCLSIRPGVSPPNSQSLTSVCACSVVQLWPTLYDPMAGSPPGSSAHGIFQAKILECVAFSFSGGSSQPRDQTRITHICISRWILCHCATLEAPLCLIND